MPKFIKVSPDMTLEELKQIVGSQNIGAVLALNNLPYVANIGEKVFEQATASMIDHGKVSNQRKYTMLNGMTGDSDVFETAAMSDEAGWRQLNKNGNLPGYIKIPDTVTIADSVNVLGNGVSVPKTVYADTMKQIKETGTVSPDTFNYYSFIVNTGTTPYQSDLPWNDTKTINTKTFQNFKLPWGDVSLYSSLSDSKIDFPVYPETVSDKRKANYNTMPDLLYQYEPWQLYQSSGPRENTYTFKFHRDMWTGDHRDGKANELIRFCEANCYPNYDGSTVNTSTVTLLVKGRKLITGVVTDVSTDWEEPIGLDGWYLFCTLSITIVEVASEPLNYRKVKSLPLIG